jgi:hypothetical protein
VDAGPSPRAPTAHLLVLAHGFGLGSGPSHWLPALEPDRPPALVPLDIGIDDPAAQVLDALPAQELRDLGLRLDRGSLVWPAAACDEERDLSRWERCSTAAAPSLAVLGITAPLTAAMVAGPDAPGYARACEGAAAAIVRARRALARRGPVHLWLCALGAPEPVSSTWDVRRRVDSLLGPVRASARVEVFPDRAHIACANHRTAAALRLRLHDSEFACATVQDLGMGRLLLLPPRGVAFGSRHVHARAPHAATAGAAALLPAPPRTTARLDLRGVAVRCALAAAALGEDRVLTPDAPRLSAAVTAPDLLPLLRRGDAGAGTAASGMGDLGAAIARALASGPD